ncbi:MAG: cytochrome ubiquinol oxidase subunit I [Armatimonadota bacterium]|jgi:cytochrome d ubiquinol oxidase subunit I
MDAVALARIQFAVTVGFHYIFPSLTIGLAWLIFWIMTRYWRTGEPIYRAMARFWIKLFGLSFAVGVATGIVMEFQFGTNWAGYSRFVGDIFGAPLAAEALLAFFLESTFLGVLLLGWNRVSVRGHWFSSLMVAVGATLSGFWIVAANSWMQTPAGYEFNEALGRAELTSFAAAVLNPSTVPRFLHTIAGTLVSGAFFMLGISAWYLLKGRHTEFARRSLRPALLLGFVGSVGQLGLGHYHAVQVAATQPEKLAAIEGIFETQRRAPALLFGIPDPDAERMRAAIRVPGLLSLMAFGSLDAEVRGLKDVPRGEWPPVALTFYSFHLMVALGMYFIALTAVGLVLLWRRALYGHFLYLRVALTSIALPVVAAELGWITAEVGRQPWIVYRLLRTSDAVSVVVPAGQVLFSLIMFCLIYALLFAVWVYLVWREMRRGPEPPGGTPGGEVSQPA